MIIDTSYFSLPPLQIPNAEDNTPNNSGRNYAAKTGLQAFIDRYEDELLFNALGSEQLTELKNQFNVDGTWKDDALQKWKDLVDGTGEWMGLRKTYGEYKVSLIAYYVFYHYLKDTESFYATTGIVKPDVANSLSISANVNLVTQWNKFVTMYQGDKCYGNYWESIWFDWQGFYPAYLQNTQSFINYINNNPELYNGSFVSVYGFKNRFGL